MDATPTVALDTDLMEPTTPQGWVERAYDASREAARRVALAVIRGLPEATTRRLQRTARIVAQHATASRLAMLAGRGEDAERFARAAERAARAHRRITCPVTAAA